MENNNRIDGYGLTLADKQAWWEFIKYHFPRYYDGAVFYYSGQRDPNLEPDYVPQDMDINDYLHEFYGLPRISTNKEKDCITVNGIDGARFSSHALWEKKREEFIQLKTTSKFKEWKTEQYKCQNGRCAWCKKHIEPYSESTHVDHIIPLLWDGTNDLNNLVLACSDCNIEKGANMHGYNGERNFFKENKKPSWIRPNKFAEPSQFVKHTTDVDFGNIPF